MKLDIYKRAETGGQFSYLAVPEGEMIPEEATNIEWQDVERGMELNEDEEVLSAYAIVQPIEQISSKGYAITSINDIDSASANH